MAVGAGVHALTPSPPGTDPVQVAARDLPAGHVLAPDDLVTVAWPRGSRPDGTLADVRGQVLASAVRRGEPVTDRRVTGPGLLAGQPPGTVAVTVRLTDAASVALLAPGRRVDLLAGPQASDLADGDATGDGWSGNGTTSGGTVLASGVLVLALPPAGGSEAGSSLWPDSAGAGSGGQAGGGAVVVAVDRGTASRLAAASGSRSISVALTSAS